MPSTLTETACCIHQHLDPREAARVMRLLERVSQGLNLHAAASVVAGDQVLAACPYLKMDGPSSLCAEHCHLHHLVFEETWP